MGPRLDRRGNSAAERQIADMEMLQWGHAWIGVGITAGRPAPRNVPWLQWGHAWIGVGMGRMPSDRKFFASLQWGHAWIGVGIPSWSTTTPAWAMLQWGHAWIGVGIIHTALKRSYGFGASMGPRLDRRGNQVSQMDRLKHRLLQWGHAWIGVGIGSRPASAPRSRRFNGATPG